MVMVDPEPRAPRGLQPASAKKLASTLGALYVESPSLPPLAVDASPVQFVPLARVMRHTDDARAGRREFMDAPGSQ